MKIKYIDAHPHAGGYMTISMVVSGDRELISRDVQMAKEQECDFEIHPPRKGRSKDANAYAWVLIDKLAAVLRRSKTEIYREAIRDIGGVSTVVCVMDKAKEDFRKNWESKGIGWQTEELPSKMPGCTNLIVYYGSSCYDTRQMTALIDQLIEDCKDQGIETLTPLELAALKGYGGKEHDS